jgi:hypothetical protein
MTCSCSLLALSSPPSTNRDVMPVWFLPCIPRLVPLVRLRHCARLFVVGGGFLAVVSTASPSLTTNTTRPSLFLIRRLGSLTDYIPPSSSVLVTSWHQLYAQSEGGAGGKLPVFLQHVVRSCSSFLLEVTSVVFSFCVSDGACGQRIAYGSLGCPRRALGPPSDIR